MSVVAVVLQARMGSTRLPGKALETLSGLSLLGHCIRRLQGSAVGPVVLATTTNDEDDALAAEADRLGVSVYRGSDADVLERFVEAADRVGASSVVRATGDNPAVDVGSAVRLVNILARGGVDHAVEAGLPYGSTVEALTFAALQNAAERAHSVADREHVTTFIRRPHSGFRCAIVPAPAALWRPDLRFTVDTPDDLAYMRRVMASAERAGEGGAPLTALIAAADRLGPRQEVA